jgi:hypothetical protein
VVYVIPFKGKGDPDFVPAGTCPQGKTPRLRKTRSAEDPGGIERVTVTCRCE